MKEFDHHRAGKVTYAILGTLAVGAFVGLMVSCFRAAPCPTAIILGMMAAPFIAGFTGKR